MQFIANNAERSFMQNHEVAIIFWRIALGDRCVGSKRFRFVAIIRHGLRNGEHVFVVDRNRFFKC